MGTYRDPAEFRADAVALGPVSRIADELGVNAETLRQWVKKAADTAGHSDSLPPAAPAQPAKDTEITRLRRQAGP